MPSNIKAVDKYVTPTCVGNNIDEFLEVSKYLELITSVWHRGHICSHSSFCDGLCYMSIQVNPEIQT